MDDHWLTRESTIKRLRIGSVIKKSAALILYGSPVSTEWIKE